MTVTPRAFPHRLAGHCGSGALRDLLEFHGLDYGGGALAEGPVFGLAGGLGFFYGEFPGFSPPFYLVGRTGELEQDFADNLDVGLEVRRTSDADEGWRWVRDEVNAGRPPMVWADIAKLDYLRVRMSNTRHDIVVTAYDERAGIVWIADNDREELQACALTSLAAARSSDGFPGPNDHTTFFYDWPAKLADPNVAVRRAVRRALENMTATAPAVGDVPGKTGLAGVDAFRSAYPQWPDTLGDDLPIALRALSVFIVKAGTGGAMFRSLHAEFLHFAADLLNDSDLREAAVIYDELSDAWIALAATAGEGDHAAGLAHVSRIATLEHDGVASMRGLP